MKQNFVALLQLELVQGSGRFLGPDGDLGHGASLA
jgi:hypothetical protein